MYFLTQRDKVNTCFRLTLFIIGIIIIIYLKIYYNVFLFNKRNEDIILLIMCLINFRFTCYNMP